MLSSEPSKHIYQVGRLVIVTVQIQEVVGWKIFQVIYVEEISKR